MRTWLIRETDDGDRLLLRTDQNKNISVLKNPHTLLKYVKFGGKRILYQFSEEARVEEDQGDAEYIDAKYSSLLRELKGPLTCRFSRSGATYIDGPVLTPSGTEVSRFTCYLNGESLVLITFASSTTVKTRPDRRGKLIIDDHCSNRNVWPRRAIDMLAKTVLAGDIEAYTRVWKLFHAIGELGLDVLVGDRWVTDLLLQYEVLSIPDSLAVTVDKETTYANGSHVAKILFEITAKDSKTFNLFRRNRRAVALIGRNKTGRTWMRFVPVRRWNTKR